jgi:hypothetical protein
MVCDALIIQPLPRSGHGGKPSTNLEIGAIQAGHRILDLPARRQVSPIWSSLSLERPGRLTPLAHVGGHSVRRRRDTSEYRTEAGRDPERGFEAGHDNVPPIMPRKFARSL